MKFRSQWWSFQPLAIPDIPLARNSWSSHPIDRFLLRSMREKDLEPAVPAAKRQVVRRLYFALIGLPPSPEQMREAMELSHAALVDHLLLSTHFGERWARHWMDWFRYAESHGSEGDPKIPHVYRYRDYLIRALNADVPYDQLIREHIAGDLLPQPRVNETQGINESAHGIAHFRLVQHGYQPTEPRMEQVRFVDDQIDVVSKAFLGLTVSCARCHDHKFDPISQEDYYAMFGIMRSAMPGIISVDAPGRLNLHRARLKELKDEIRDLVADEWLKFADQIPTLLESEPGLLEKLDLASAGEYAKRWRKAIKSATPGNTGNPFHVWNRLKTTETDEFADRWLELKAEQQSRFETNRVRLRERFRRGWNPTTIQSEWFPSGTAWQEGVTRAGGFFVDPSEGKVIRAIYPRGVYSHLVSSKHNGVLNSPKFPITSDSISIRLMGDDLAQARLVLGDYPVARGGIYGQRSQPDHEGLVWYQWDTTYWKGEEAHIEIAKQDDLMIFVKAYRSGSNANTRDGRSYIGITDVVFSDDGQGKPEELFTDVFEVLRRGAPGNPAELAVHYRDTCKNSIEAWRTRNMDDYQASFLNFFVQQDLIPNSEGELPSLKRAVGEYRKLEGGIPVATRVSGVIETVGRDQALLLRGDFEKPGDPIDRRFLSLYGGRKYETELSGRLELAEDLLQADNALIPRVLVNRVWAYLFGEGLVHSSENFGRLGRKPTHPELLDHLASWFVENGYSIKRLIGYIAKTRAFQLSRSSSNESVAADSANVYLSHFSVRRLDAESIRDAVLATSGRLDRTLYGPSQPGTGNRRSIYVRSPRNNPDEFLKIFDMPEPLSTKGKRDVTNVPAQSLALLNTPFVQDSARVLGEEIGAISELDEEQRIQRLFETVLGRPANVDDLNRVHAFRRSLLVRAGDVSDKRQRVAEAHESAVAEREKMLAPVRERIRSQLEHQGTAVPAPKPIAIWDFEKNADDRLSGLKVQLVGDARIEQGALVVNGGRAHAISDKLPFALKAKTLEAWVQLADLRQRGGGVMSVQTPDGVHFDAIVFGEREPEKWLAGSNGFTRTKSFGGSREIDAASRTVHVAIVYSEDGSITGYRDGLAYGLPYKSNGPKQYQRDATVVTFGVRHLPAVGNRLLQGRIHEARLYNFALSAEEVAASAGRSADFVSEQRLLTELSEDERDRHESLQVRIQSLAAEKNSLAEMPTLNVRSVWVEIAHAMFNLKEFIYLR